jgi:hypothetical protein
VGAVVFGVGDYFSFGARWRRSLRGNDEGHWVGERTPTHGGVRRIPVAAPALRDPRRSKERPSDGPADRRDDMHKAILAIADDRMFFPLKPRFARNIITGLCRTKAMRED